LDVTVLTLDIATFTVVATSGTTMTYQWYKDGNPIPGATSAIFTILSVTPSDDGRYYVRVTNAYGTRQSAWANLDVLSAPSITTQPVSKTATEGQSVSLSVKATANPSPNYQWLFNGVPLPEDAKNSTLTFPSVDWSNSGTYTVIVSNPYGSVTSAPVTLTITGNLPVTLTTAASPIPGSSGFAFQFSVQPGFTYVVAASTDLVH
jgi:membrane carboxypeptidase/penicillin-binding protein PbpC